MAAKWFFLCRKLLWCLQLDREGVTGLGVNLHMTGGLSSASDDVHAPVSPFTHRDARPQACLLFFQAQHNIVWVLAVPECLQVQVPHLFVILNVVWCESTAHCHRQSCRLCNSTLMSLRVLPLHRCPTFPWTGSIQHEVMSRWPAMECS